MPTKVVFFKKESFKDAVLFTGLPGIGLVGKICVDYLLKEFKAKKIATVFSDSFPPSVHTKNSIVNLIQDEVYAFESEGKPYLFLAGPVQPSLDISAGSSQEHYEFASTLVEAAKHIGVKKIFTLAGISIGEKRMEREPRVIVAATNEKMLEWFKEVGAKADKKEGLISGAAGLILGIAKEHGIEGACLMGETNANLIYGDHGAAKKVVELLAKRFGFKVNMKDLEEESKKIEAAFKQLAEQFEEPEEEEDLKHGPSYVR